MRAASSFLFYYEGSGGTEDYAKFKQNGAVELYHDGTKKFETASAGIDVTGNDIKLLGPTSGSTFTTSTLTLRGYRQSTAGQFANIDFNNIDANSSNTEYIGARISGQLGANIDGGELKFFVTPNSSTTLSSTPSLILHGDSSAEFSSNLTVGGNLTVNGTTTTINSTTLTVDDLNITLASGAADSAAADGAGITIDGANESLLWADSNKSFRLSTRLAIGPNTSQSANLRLSKDVGGENVTTYYAFLNNGLIQPDVTGTAYYNFVQVRTDGNNGTGYTISNLDAYSASVGSGTINADTTITNLIGFEVKNTWIEGTRNYGFRGLIPTGTNRWNVYMDGSAPNYFAGNVGIGTDNPTKILHIAGNNSVQEIKYGHNSTGYFLSNTEVNRSGANQAIHNYHYRWDGTKVAQMSVVTGDDTVNKDNGYFTFETASAGTTEERLRIDAGGNVIIGASGTPATVGQTQLTLRSNSQVGLALLCGAIQNSSIYMGGLNDGYSPGDSGYSDGKIMYDNNNNHMQFDTAGTERLRIKSDGNVGIGTNNPTEKLDVAGVAIASLLVDSIYASETWPAGDNTLAGNDLGTWTLTGGVLNTPTSGTDDYHMVDKANLPDGLNAITWSGNNSTSYLTSPDINITNLRTNTGMFGGIGGYASSADRTVADSRIYLTALLAAQSMDNSAEYMEVELSSDGGTTWVPDVAFVSQDGDSDDDDITDTYWRKIVIDISEYSSSTFQIRFKGTGDGTGDGYGVSNIYIHEAPIPNRLQAKTLKLGDGKIANSTYEHSNALTLVASGGTSKLIVLENDGDPRQNYIGISQSDNLEFAADEDNVGDNSGMRFRIDGKQRMRLYTGTDANAEEAHLQLIGDPTPSDRSNWRITAQDDGTHGYFTISDFSGASWNNNLTVHEGGNVGIGTTDPTHKLEVVGHVKIDSGPVLAKSSSVSGSNNTALRITSNTGWVEVGSQNTTYAHFYTDRDRYYFNKKLIVDEGIISAYNENLQLATGNDGSDVKMTLGTDGVITVPSTGMLKISNAAATSNSDAAMWLNGTGGAILIDDNAQKRITWNDGGGNFQIRAGHRYSSGQNLRVVANDGAAKLGFDTDGVSGTIKFKVAGTSASTTDNISWAQEMTYSTSGLGMNVTTPARGPLHIHQGTTGDTQIHMTNSETGTSSDDGFTIFQGAGSSGEDCGFVNREVNGRIRFLMDPTGMGPNDVMVLLANGNLGIGASTPVDKLHVQGGDAYFSRRVGIGTTDNSGYQCTIKNSASTSTSGMFMDCNDWSSNASEYGINLDIDSTNRTNLSANRTHRGISSDVQIRAAQNASTTTGTRQSAYGIYGRVIFNDTDDNDGKIYYAWGGVFTGRVDGVNASNVRGSYSLGQCGDNATGSARTVDNVYGAVNYAINDGNQTTITNAYGTYSHVNQDDSGGTMSTAYGVYSRVDRDGGTGVTGYAYRGVFEGTWTTKRGLWITGDTENSMDGSFTAGSKMFRIRHPLPELSETKDLVHVSVEAPAHDLIYRGKSELIDGSATINLDTKFGMTEGTFVALNRDVQCFTSNESDWSAVRGSVSGNILTIECQDSSSTATVSWIVIGERQDDGVKSLVSTDADGNLILEPDQRPEEPEQGKPEIPD